MTGCCFVVVRQRAVKGILAWCEFYRRVVASVRRIGVVKPSVTFGPLVVPAARAIRHRIIFGWLFTNPENRGYDLSFPWITFAGLRRCRAQTIWGEHQRVNADNRLALRLL